MHLFKRKEELHDLVEIFSLRREQLHDLAETSHLLKKELQERRETSHLPAAVRAPHILERLARRFWYSARLRDER
jgi:hypothetical protein